MNKISRIIFAVLIAAAMVLTMTACASAGTEVDYTRIESITVDEASVADSFLLSEFDITKIMLNVKYKDVETAEGTETGETVQIPVTMSMVKAEDKAKLRVAGVKEITLIYGKFTIPLTFTITDDATVKYKVIFFDRDGERQIGDPQYVDAGGSVVPPGMETVEGYVFVGWQDRDNGIMSTLTGINKPLYLVAVYQPNIYDVKFFTRVNGNETLIATVKVPRGANAADYAPPIPSDIEGYSNGHWENLAGMANIGSGELEFYAVYDADHVQIGFNYKRYGEASQTYYVSYNVGSKIQKTQMPPAEYAGYRLVEWRIDGKKVEFPYTVMVETVMTAHYVPIVEGSPDLLIREVTDKKDENNANGDESNAGASDEERLYEVYGYTGTDPVVAIPEQYMVKVDGKSVVKGDIIRIADEAFKDCDISEFVVSNTNKYFKTLDGVLFDHSLTTLLAYPKLKNASSYSLVRADNQPTITKVAPYAFYSSALSEISFNDELSQIGQYAFAECYNLVSVSIPSSLESIDKNAFAVEYGVSSLESVSFADAKVLLSIGDNAFTGQTNLTRIALPASLRTLGNGVFKGCISLTAVTAIDNVNFEVRNGMLYSAGRSKLYLYPALYSGNVNPCVRIDPDCNEIVSGAFSHAKIKGIIIQSGLTIDDYAIVCPNLTDVAIVPNVPMPTVKPQSFGNCVPMNFYIDEDRDNGLSQMFKDSRFLSYSGNWSVGNDYSDGYIYEIYEYVVESENGSALQTGIKIMGAKFNPDILESHRLVLPDYIAQIPVTAIGERAFEDDNLIEEIILPSELRTVEPRAFYGMKKLSAISLSDTLMTLGEQAFADCINLVSVNFDRDNLLGITDIGENAFAGTPFFENTKAEFITVGNALIKYTGFSESVTIDVINGAKISYIASDVFKGRGEITSLVLKNVTHIAPYAFQYCTGLAKVTFPSVIEVIGENAFADCNLLVAEFTGINSTDNRPVRRNAYSSSVKEVFENYKNADTNPNWYTIVFNEGGDSTDSASGTVFLEDPIQVENKGSQMFAGWYFEDGSVPGTDYKTLLTFPFDPSFPDSEEIKNLIAGRQTFTVYARFVDAESGTEGLEYRLTDEGDYAVVGYNGTDDYVIIPPRYKGRSVRVIEKEAFKGKDFVEKIIFPRTKGSTGAWYSNLNEIGENAFDDTNWYKKISGDMLIVDDFLIKYKGNTDGVEVIIPDYVTKIAKGAFKNCNKIKRVVFGAESGVEKLGDEVFSGCTKLEEVVLPAGLISIGENAFRNCTNLKSIDFDKCASLSSVRYNAMEGSGWLADYSGSCVMIRSILYKYRGTRDVNSLHLFNGITVIGERAFAGDVTLSYVFISQSVTNIGDEAFFRSNVSAINLYAGGSNLIRIGDKAFYGCINLSTIDLSLASNLIYIGEYAFGGGAEENGVFVNCNSLKLIHIPAAVTFIGEGAFRYAGLTNVVFEAGNRIEQLSSYVFADCVSLFTVNFGGASALVEIGESAFENCRSLRDFINPLGNVASLGARSFYDCSNLVNFTINETALQDIGDDALYKVGYIRENNSNMVVIGNILVEYNGYDTTVDIPSNITTIYNGAFRGNTRITKVAFNRNTADREYKIRNINAEAFSGCSQLSEIDFPDSIVYVGNGAMEGTKWLSDRDREEFIIISNTLIKYNGLTVQQVILPEYVEIICADAFNGSTVYDILIGPSVKRIDACAFDGIIVDEDYGKWTLTVQAANPPIFDIEADYLDGHPGLAEIILPSVEVKENYILNDSWGQLADILQVKDRYKVTFMEKSGAWEMNEVYALYSEVESAMADDNGDVFGGWYLDDPTNSSNPKRVIYPYILKEDLILYAVYTSLETGSEYIKEQIIVYDGEDENFEDGKSHKETINIYQGRDMSKLVIVKDYVGVDITRIGSGFVSDRANGEYVLRNNKYVYVGTGESTEVKHSRRGAFEGHNELTEVLFVNQSAVSIIGANAFKDCKNLRRIVLPASLKVIESGAFDGCDKLEEVVFSPDCTDVEIKGGAFRDCKSLRSISLPKGVVGLEDKAFENCDALRDIYIESDKPVQLIDGETVKLPFEKVDGMIIHIPNKTKPSYEESWKEYKEYLEEEASSAENENENTKRI